MGAVSGAHSIHETSALAMEAHTPIPHLVPDGHLHRLAHASPEDERPRRRERTERIDSVVGDCFRAVGRDEVVEGELLELGPGVAGLLDETR